MLEARGIRHGYGGEVVVSVEKWAAEPGEQWLISGPSGCGKTTLLHILAGLLRAAAGEVRIGGTALSSLSGAALDRFRGRHVGIVFQQLHLIEALTVQQNLMLAQSLAGLDAAPARVEEMLAGLGLADKLRARPHTLSRGQAQRVALARALINRPAILLADEPTSSLDDANAEQAIALLRDRAAVHGAVLVVASHDRRLRGLFAQRLDLTRAA